MSRASQAGRRSGVDIGIALSVHQTRDGDDLFLGTLRGIEDRTQLERQRDVGGYLASRERALEARGA